MTYDIPENAKILSITGDYETVGSDGEDLVGLKIETNKGDIKLLISSYQSCCENWEALFLETPDDLSKVIGAKLISVSDLEIETNEYDSDSDELRETQLRVTTTKGIIQFAVYNEHNGYYSHATFLQVFDMKEHGGL